SKVFARRCRKGFVSTLHDSLSSDVNPASGGHLAVHRKFQRFKTIEFLARRPMGYEVRIRNQYSRSVRESSKRTDRLSGLDKERFVIPEVLQRSNDRVERVPASRCTSRAAIDNELSRIFRNLFVKIVHQHPHCGFLVPTFAGEYCS